MEHRGCSLELVGPQVGSHGLSLAWKSTTFLSVPNGW